jgi:hypothetical protein
VLKISENTFNTQLEPLSKGTLKRWRGKKSKVEFNGFVRLVTQMTDEDSPGRPMDDVWDIPVINSQAKERLGYPTQKPETLLERIIEASSNKGQVVLDPFCGCGTAVAVAHRLKRKWIGIDITCLAIALIKNRLQDTFSAKIKNSYTVIGEPVSLFESENLAKEDPYQFQWWALGLVGARPVEGKKGTDKGIDGRIYFHEGKGETKQVIISVKAGKVTVSQLRDLKGVVEREKAQIGVLISMQEPTKQMRTEAASSGFYKSLWGNHPKIQALTIQEILNGKPIDYPRHEGTDLTFKKAKRVESGKAIVDELDFEPDEE